MDDHADVGGVYAKTKRNRRDDDNSALGREQLLDIETVRTACMIRAKFERRPCSNQLLVLGCQDKLLAHCLGLCTRRQMNNGVPLE